MLFLARSLRKVTKEEFDKVLAANKNMKDVLDLNFFIDFSSYND